MQIELSVTKIYTGEDARPSLHHTEHSERRVCLQPSGAGSHASQDHWVSGAADQRHVQV